MPIILALLFAMFFYVTGAVNQQKVDEVKQLQKPLVVAPIQTCIPSLARARELYEIVGYANILQDPEFNCIIGRNPNTSQLKYQLEHLEGYKDDDEFPKKLRQEIFNQVMNKRNP